MTIDYLIIGQGLAGSILSYKLIKHGCKIVVIDKDEMPASSKIAAGIFNPITGRKMVKTWNADKLFPELSRFYPEIELFLNSSFYHPMPIYRPFLNPEEQNDWMGKSLDEGFRKYIKGNYTQPRNGEVVFDDYGGLELNFGGYVDINTLLTSFRNFLVEKNLLLDEAFEEEKLIFKTSGIQYRDFTAKCVIYCDGPTGAETKAFSWLPYRRVKGELLIIKLPVQFDAIINRGVFVLPIGEYLYKVGSTYDWKDMSWNTTKLAANQIEDKLKKLLKCDFEIIDHIAGIRPATLDRKPFLGHHPTNKRQLVFNGFGTKGVSLMPYFGEKLCQFLIQGTKLPEEANISRYFSLY